MKTESTVKPPESAFTIERLKCGKCNVHLFENIEKTTNTYGDTIYTYDLYILRDIRYHNKLGENMEAYYTKWLEKAKAAENEEPAYTEIQRLQQDMTDLMLENIEQGQYITELELLIMGGNKNV